MRQVCIIYKIGVESFDRDFRENYLNKYADFKDAKEKILFFYIIAITIEFFLSHHSYFFNFVYRNA